MAIGTPTERAAVSSVGGAGATNTFSPTGTLAAGNTAIIIAWANINKAASSVTDDAGGNTWTVDVTGGDGTRNFSFISSVLATQLTTGNVITINWNPTTGGGSSTFWLFEITGLSASPAYDVSAHSSGTGTALAVGPTATLSQADEIAFMIARSQSAAPGWTKGATWTSPATATLGALSVAEWKIVAATTAVTADGTWGTSVNWNGRVATYKGAAAAGTEDPYPYVDGGYYPTQG